MDGTAVKAIAELEDLQKTIEVEGQVFSRKDFSPVFFEPRSAAIGGMTLDGLVEYIKTNPEGMDFSRAFIQVDDFATVRLYDGFSGKDKKRTVFYEVDLDKNLPVFPFDQFLPLEEFIIKMGSLFAPTPDLAEVVALVSKVVAQDEIITADNGLSQNLTVKKGVSGAITEGTVSKGSYVLRPFRTFREIQQPESRFILRLRPVEGGLPKAALFDADGGSWRLYAVMQIQKYLREMLEREVNGSSIPVLL